MAKRAISQWLRKTFAGLVDVKPRQNQLSVSQKPWTFATLKSVFRDILHWSAMKFPRPMLLPKDTPRAKSKQIFGVLPIRRMTMDKKKPKTLTVTSLPAVFESPSTVHSAPPTAATPPPAATPPTATTPSAAPTVTPVASTSAAATSDTPAPAVNTTTALQIKPTETVNKSPSSFADHPLRIRDGVLNRSLYYKRLNSKQ